MSFCDRDSPQQGALPILQAYYPVVKTLGAYLEAVFDLNSQNNLNELYSSLTSPSDTDTYTNLLRFSYVASKVSKPEDLRFYHPMLDMREVSSPPLSAF